MIKRARLRAEVEIPDSKSSYVQTARHPDGVLLSLYEKESRRSRYLLISPKGQKKEFHPGWSFEDGIVSAVDARGRLAAWRWFGDRVLRRYGKGELDATYPLSFLDAGYDLAFLPDGRLLAAGGPLFQVYSQQATPQRDLARLVNRGAVVSADANADFFALTQDAALLRLDSNGVVKRLGETGLLRPDTVRAAGESVWCVDTVSGELISSSPDGHPCSTADADDLGLPAIMGRTLVAFPDGSAAVVGSRDSGACLAVFE